MKHGDNVMQAEEDGSYLLFPADYSYQVKAAGYKTARGTFTLGEADTTVKVTMVPGIEWDGTVADGFAGGTGTQADPYLISNGEELAYLSAQVASGNAFAGKYVTLAANLDMGNVAFTPIGSDAAALRAALTARITRSIICSSRRRRTMPVCSAAWIPARPYAA